MKDGHWVELHMEVDGEGVVRISGSASDKLELTRDELAKVLTALVKALTGPDDEAQEVNVLLN